MSSSLDSSDASSTKIRAVRHRQPLRRCAENGSAVTSSLLRLPSPSPSRSRSNSRSRSTYDYLYTSDGAANLVNFVDFLGREHVPVEKDILLENAEGIGAGSTMNVFAGDWKGRRVAVKSLKPERKPVRHVSLTLEQDTEYRHAIREFYTDVQSIMQEVQILSRVPPKFFNASFM